MAATSDRIPEEQQADPDKVKEQPLTTKNKTLVFPNSPQDAAPMGHPSNGTGQSGSFVSAGERNVYSPTIYAPQPQAFYYRGYDNTAGEWDEYPQYVNADGLELGSMGVFNENPSLVFHPVYGYNPQMPYGPYSPVTTPLPSVGGDAQLYSPLQFPFSGPPYYQHLVPPNMPYINSPSPVSRPELTTLVNVDQQGGNILFGPMPSYPSPLGSFGRGNLPGNPGTLGFNDLQQGFDGFRSGGLWSDWSKPSDRQRSFTPISPALSPHPIGHNVPMAPQHQRSFYPLGSGMNSYNRGYPQSGLNQGAGFLSASVPSIGANSWGWLPFDSKRQRGRDSDISLCGCSSALDILSEQNRGPRASKPKNQITAENYSSVDDNNNKTSTKIKDNSFNWSDFTTDYKDAKFFIIKSYSEDNVHKSIKYGVWASTPNGNKRLDTAYDEAMEHQDSCPVFLFFSVNGSAQFCGVAEMVGPVDFDKSVDYWQQDKWSGQFPVKWHSIKDVPNSQFRHIILENNDNKPVTNSRDTQEVKLEQGLEMLSIFKSYETDISILDDFDFYEDRQKAMQERKARQQATLMSVGVVGESEHRNAVTLSNDFIKQMSKSFAQVVCLDDGNKEGTGIERTNSASDGSKGARVKLEDVITAAASSAQAS
ncbi:YTH domain-containing protein ECT4-like isoform X2 [Hibiscus syriacus]|uniref:YTH domain-containing protein ECT4-like isoform X2 n=1 Tax=Hibiscus syriacus TaxID=106335 RepID=UPI00192345AB|nr:YTH domain-containing protein ECT4-like isoform X2 [Hibiscus syriacus]